MFLTASEIAKVFRMSSEEARSLLASGNLETCEVAPGDRRASWKSIEEFLARKHEVGRYRIATATGKSVVVLSRITDVDDADADTNGCCLDDRPMGQVVDFPEHK